jgi:hypothetical protein
MTIPEMLALAAKWTAPVNRSAPAGVSVKEDDRYLWLSDEVARLERPTTERVDWNRFTRTVIDVGGELLQEKSKDLVVASYVAYALYRRDGLAGLRQGVALLTALIENFWPALHPELKRLRGRAAALQWFLDKSEVQLQLHRPAPSEREALADLRVIVDRLRASAHERFGASTPSFGGLRGSILRLAHDVEALAEASPPPEAADSARRAPAEGARPPVPALVVLRCPNCGAPLPAAAGGEVTCAYCNAVLLRAARSPEETTRPLRAAPSSGFGPGWSFVASVARTFIEHEARGVVVTVPGGALATAAYWHHAQAYDDVTVEVSVQVLTSGDPRLVVGGINLRAASDADGYRFAVSGDGYYRLSRRVHGALTTLVDWTSAAALQAGARAENRLRVAARGSTIALGANGVRLCEISDATFPRGNLGLQIQAGDPGDPRETRIAFRDLVIAP